jgi:MiaB-like tRNA modifying enzyme
LESYGCTLNHGEARYLIRLIGNAGHVQVKYPEDSDVIVIFTCTVIRTTELKMVRQLQKFSELAKPVIVSGCMAVVQRKQLLEVLPNVYFLPPKELNNIYDILDELSESLGIKAGIRSQTELEHVPETTSIDFIIPISTGCEGQCTYCVTRLARGALDSYSPEHILKQVKGALDKGHYELRLTAQDTGCYGYDSNLNLPQLLNSITDLETEHEFRVRVGMMNPDSVKPIINDLIESYQHQRIFKFLHIPVQSGDDEILKAMNRKYSVSDFFKLIKNFREAIPNLTISTDIIVGYPGESEEQFNKSLGVVEQLQPNIVNITRFSARPGTPAAKIKNKLPGSVVKARSRKLTDLRFKISKNLNNIEIGKEYSVLITERVKPGTVLARTDQYQPVVVKKPLALGKWIDIKVTSATDAYLIAVPKL